MADKTTVRFKYYLCDADGRPAVTFIASKGHMDDKYLYLSNTRYPLEKIDTVSISNNRIVFAIQLSAGNANAIKISVVGGCEPEDIAEHFHNVILSDRLAKAVAGSTLDQDTADEALALAAKEKEYVARLTKRPDKCPNCSGRKLEHTSEPIKGTLLKKHIYRCLDCACSWIGGFNRTGLIILGICFMIAGIFLFIVGLSTVMGDQGTRISIRVFLFCAMVFPLLFMSGAYVLYNAIKTRTLPRLLSFGENRGSPFAQAIKSAANNIGANAVDASADDVDEDEYEDDSEYAETDDDTPAAPPLTEALKKEYLTSLRGNPKKCPHCGGTNLTMQQGYSEEISSDAKLMKCEDCGYTWRPAVDSPFFWWLGVVLIILGICGVILQVVGWSSESGARLPPFIFVGGFITIYIGIKTIVFSFGLKGKTAIIAAGITSKDKASS